MTDKKYAYFISFVIVGENGYAFKSSTIVSDKLDSLDKIDGFASFLNRQYKDKGDATLLNYQLVCEVSEEDLEKRNTEYPKGVINKQKEMLN